MGQMQCCELERGRQGGWALKKGRLLNWGVKGSRTKRSPGKEAGRRGAEEKGGLSREAGEGCREVVMGPADRG